MSARNAWWYSKARLARRTRSTVVPVRSDSRVGRRYFGWKVCFTEGRSLAFQPNDIAALNRCFTEGRSLAFQPNDIAALNRSSVASSNLSFGVIVLSPDASLHPIGFPPPCQTATPSLTRLSSARLNLGFRLSPPKGKATPAYRGGLYIL